MKALFILLLQILFISTSFSQNTPENIPSDIQEYLLRVKESIKLKLDSCRINVRLGNWCANPLSICLSTPLEEKVNSLGLMLDWKMVYDDEMIERMVQLLKNEYRKEELDLLTDRQMNIYGKHLVFEELAVSKIRTDTSKVFLNVKDSLNKYRDKIAHDALYDNFDVFMHLKMDTTVLFQHVLDSVTSAKREDVIHGYLNNIHFNMLNLVEVCGYINNMRFVQPLINIAENPEKFNESNPGRIKESAIISLAQMNIEPYYSDLLKSYTFSLEEIRNKKVVVYLHIFHEVFNTQEAFRELSKYLFSSAYTMLTSEGPDGVAYEDTFRLITQNIENEELWKIIGDPQTFNLKEGRFKIYDWMQENYGEYKIKRFW
jgi:hypothetical protein